jgi:hypothetical protein
LSAATVGRRTEAPSTDSSAKVVFALLVLACFAAFFVTQRLKHTPTAVQQFRMTPRFSPTGSGHIKQERVSFKLANADDVTVTIINARGDLVATLVREHPVPRYKVFSLRWNGRLGTAGRYALLPGTNGRTIVLPANEGALAPAGEYRVRVRLRGRALPVLSPRSFTLIR